MVFHAAAEGVLVRIAGDGAPTRLTISTDAAESEQLFSAISASGERELIVLLASTAEDASGTGMGGVTDWRLEGRKLTFTLDRPMAAARVLTLPPTGAARQHRLIIDLETVSEARFASRARKDTPRFARALENADAAAELAGTLPDSSRGLLGRRGNARFTVVIDPGHGGKDPGARAITSGVEKDITLAAALTLKKLLEKNPRYDVYLTRDDDSYVALEDRVTRARRYGADLFISLHADAAGSSEVAGASLYTISARGEKRVDKEADRNDWRIPIEDGTPEQVTGILEDMVKRETKTHSAEFAEALLPELAEAGPVLRGTHRNAGFYVLLAPDVPAVLLEMGFLTNKADAERLKSESGRLKCMTAVQKGIDRYFDLQAGRVAG